MHTNIHQSSKSRQTRKPARRRGQHTPGYIPLRVLRSLRNGEAEFTRWRRALAEAIATARREAMAAGSRR